MNRKNIDKKMAKEILFKMVNQAILFVIACFLIVLGMGFIENGYKMTIDVFLFACGILIPLSIIIIISNFSVFKNSYKQFSDLADGLEKAVEGDFYAKLDQSKAGAMSRLYENFNKVTDELKNVRNMQEEFVSNYSHELRTPISSIKGFSEILLKEDVSEEERRKYLKIISESADRLSNLAEESILIIKLDSQEILEKETYSLTEQLRNYVIMLETMWSERNIDMKIEAEEITYNGNKEIMGHLWSNLISNSIKYNKENGEIKITLKENEQQIVAIISDTGIGMTEEQISHIFEKYYQVEKSKIMKGLGIGLTIVSRILYLIDGDIEVKSELGKGSTFIVTIPK